MVDLPVLGRPITDTYPDLNFAFILGSDGGFNPAPDVEFGYHLHPVGLTGGDQIVPDTVYQMLVKDAYIAEPVYIHFQAFEFQAPFMGAVRNAQDGKIW